MSKNAAFSFPLLLHCYKYESTNPADIFHFRKGIYHYFYSSDGGAGGVVVVVVVKVVKVVVLMVVVA